MTKNINHPYPKKEETLNIWSHAIGLLLATLAFPFLVVKAMAFSNAWHLVSFIVFGLSMILLYAASTFYHAATKPVSRKRLKIFDHAAIYVLIAGSYSPFCLVALDSKLGWYMFVAVWSFAILGIILKLFFTGRFKLLSTSLYLFMGWQIVFFIKPLIASLTPENLQLLFLGGVFYSIGAVLYSIKKIPFNHAIFHLFVLLGTISHFIAIYNL